jgi:hypothetical protein
MDNKFTKVIDARPREHGRWFRKLEAQKRRRLEQGRHEASDTTMESIGPLGAFLRASQKRAKP